ncbi:MAG: hypothetical protein IJB23_01555 [Alistipes sp.]|nr:hypothetical protein [Alistipes sp.]MBQ3208482.1 hypothetical protein [Alistipes sp.]MBQ9962927.1 hypothetical protein [Alistipes sp.]
MKVTIETLAAIYNVGMAIVMADGELKPEYVAPLEKFYGGINGFTNEAMMKVVDCANNNKNLTMERSVELVKSLDVDVKKRLVNIYADIVRADEQISDKKMVMFNGVRNLCGLPAPATPLVDNSDDVIAPTFIAAKTNGLAYPFQSTAESWQELDADIAEHIGAERTEIVRFTAPLNTLSKQLGLVDCHLVFLVDREGYKKDGLGDNMTGTLLYGSGHEILGNIVFALESDNGYKLMGFTSAALIENAYIEINATVGNLLRLE